MFFVLFMKEIVCIFCLVSENRDRCIISSFFFCICNSGFLQRTKFLLVHRTSLPQLLQVQQQFTWSSVWCSIILGLGNSHGHVDLTTWSFWGAWAWLNLSIFSTTFWNHARISSLDFHIGQIEVGRMRQEFSLDDFGIEPMK